MLVQVHLDLGDQLRLVRAVGVEPEHDRHAGVARAVHGQLHPVADRGVLDLAHAPDVALFHVFAHQHFAGVQVGDVGHAVFGDLEGLVVRAVLFGLLGHEADVGHGAHGLGVEGAVPLAEVDDLLVDAGEGRFGHHGLDVLQAAVGAPHLAAVADHGGHGGVHDHVVGRVEVGDALGRVDHGQLGAAFVAGVQVALDLVLRALGQRGDLVVQVDHAVVDVDAQLVEQLAVFLEGFLVEDLHAVAEHDGVRDLHHGGLDVQREHDAGLVRVFDFLFIEGQQGLLAHEHGVDDLAVEQGDLGLEHDGLAALGEQFHLDVAGAVQRHGLFAVIEVAAVHVRDVRARGLAPLGHAVRVLAGVFLHGAGRAAVGVAFAQHGVHGAAGALVVARADVLVLVRGRVLRVVGDLVALALQFLDGRLELRHRGADVGQLDDVGFRLERELAQLGQVVGHLLVVAQELGELAQDAGGHRDVARRHVDAGRSREGAHDGQEGVGRQQGRLVGEGVDDGGLLRAHALASVGSGLSRGLKFHWAKWTFAGAPHCRPVGPGRGRRNPDDPSARASRDGYHCAP
ncbi:hypothetical protein FQZ97_548590 [compost metagenome]